jgi:hypothetical protein
MKALFRVAIVIGCLAAAMAGAASAQEMPDPSVIAGKALPASELPTGSITVRVVRRAIGNNVTGQSVTVTVGGKAQTATTDDQGRAEFKSLPPGAEGRAEATVNGEHLQSDPFQVPAQGGLRVILISEIAQAAKEKQEAEQKALAAPPTKGVVVIGGNSRILMQFQSDELAVFYLFDVINEARTRVDIGGPIQIDLPSTAGGAGAMQGSAPNVKVNGTRVTVTGPFAPGTTSVQIGYTLRYDSPDITFTQKLPIAVQQVTVGVQKVGNMAMASSQFAQTNELRTQDGMVFLVGNGPALPAGGTLTVNLSNLPLHSRIPRYTALGLAAAVILIGVWLARRSGVEEDREALMKRRDSLMSQLEQLEIKRRSGSINPEQYAARRQKMLVELEQIYGELDEAGTGPQGGGEGVAA